MSLCGAISKYLCVYIVKTDVDGINNKDVFNGDGENRLLPAILHCPSKLPIKPYVDTKIMFF